MVRMPPRQCTAASVLEDVCVSSGRDVLLAPLQVARVLRRVGRYTECVELLQHCVGIWTRLRGPAHADTLRRVRKLARALELGGRLPEALHAYHGVLGPTRPLARLLLPRGPPRALG